MCRSAFIYLNYFIVCEIYVKSYLLVYLHFMWSEESIESGAYDDRDLDHVKSNDQYLGCFVRSFSENGDLNKPTEMINTVLKFRKDIKINGICCSFHIT